MSRLITAEKQAPQLRGCSRVTPGTDTGPGGLSLSESQGCSHLQRIPPERGGMGEREREIQKRIPLGGWGVAGVGETSRGETGRCAYPRRTPTRFGMGLRGEACPSWHSSGLPRNCDRARGATAASKVALRSWCPRRHPGDKRRCCGAASAVREETHGTRRRTSRHRHVL